MNLSTRHTSANAMTSWNTAYNMTQSLSAQPVRMGIYSVPCGGTYARVMNKKQYELTDHLGNVLATISDLKVYDDVEGRFKADVVSCQDYFPGGSLQPGRNWNSDFYRFGLNGQENDNEITGITGTHTTATFWEYDTRLMRRWNLDPKPQISMSDYACFGNNPIMRIDPYGDADSGYVVDKEGYVRNVDDTGGDDYDVLYTEADYWIAQQKTRQTGETNEYGNPEPEKQLIVYDKSILPSLEKTNTKFQQEDYWGTAYEHKKYNPNTKKTEITYEIPMLQGHYCTTKNSYEAKRVFDFVASNSNVEWAMRGNVKGIWFIGTLHVDGQAPDAKLLTGYTKEKKPVFEVMADFDVKMLFYDAHSHPLDDEENDFKPSPTDISRKNGQKAENPNIQYWLFMPKNPKTKWLNYGNQ